MRIMTLAEVCEINPRKAINLPAESEISFIPMEAVSVCGEVDAGRSIQVGKTKNYSVFREKDILFAKITPCMENGKGAIAVGLKNGWGAGSTEFIILRPNTEQVLPKWIYLFLSQKAFRLNCQQNMTGSAGQKRVPAKFLAKCCIPVPSLTEQERIIARIEELFSQLDKGVETLQKTKQQLAVYRQAVLKSAFNNIENKKPIREMSSIVTSGSRGWAKYYSDAGSRFIRITDLTRDGIRLKNDSIQLVALPDEAEGKRSRLKKNDVLVSITADLGSIALIPDTVGEAYINQHIAMIRFSNPMQGEYMAWYLKSDHGQKDLLKNKRGGGKLGLGLDDIRDTPVPVVSDQEAEATLAQIEARLSVCDSIERTVDTALQQTTAMRQSVLKKAFEGGI